MYKRFFSLMAAVVLTAGLLITANSFAMFGMFEQYEKVEAESGEVRILLSDVDDGKAHHYSYQDQDREIKFFVVKSGDGVVRVAFDACDVCFPAKKGYTQDGEYMVCNNCGRLFHASQINVVDGGCNPAPLHRETVGDNLVIKVADILEGARFF